MVVPKLPTGCPPTSSGSSIKQFVGIGHIGIATCLCYAALIFANQANWVALK
jgi:hypothetical protein